jgi:hypothetical protein
MKLLESMPAIGAVSGVQAFCLRSQAARRSVFRPAWMLAFACLLGSFPAWSQSYSIDWRKVAGGGGASSNGQYALSGTLGQHDAGGPMAGARFSLTGGFWSLFSVAQTPGAPTLRIFLTTTNAVVLAWPAASTGFKLQFNADLNTTNWTDVGQVPTVVVGESQISVSPVTENRFYRLRWP